MVLNLAAQPGETEGFSPEQHLDVLSAHAPDLRVDSVLADRASVAAAAAAGVGRRAARGRLDLHDVAVPGTARHDPSRLSRCPWRRLLACGDRRRPGVAGPSAGADDRGGSSDDGQGVPGMAMTATVKDELSRVAVSKVSARKAEVSALLRFAGGLHIVAGRVIVEAELDTGAVARRLRKEIGELYGHVADVQVLAASGIAQGHPVRGAGGRPAATRWPGRPA